LLAEARVDGLRLQDSRCQPAHKRYAASTLVVIDGGVFKAQTYVIETTFSALRTDPTSLNVASPGGWAEPAAQGNSSA